MARPPTRRSPPRAPMPIGLVPVKAKPLVAVAGALAPGTLAVTPATTVELAGVPLLAVTPRTWVPVIGEVYPLLAALAGPANVIAAMITPNVTMRGARRRLLVGMRSP